MCDSLSFSRQFRSSLDCTEQAIWSWIYIFWYRHIGLQKLFWINNIQAKHFHSTYLAG